MKSYQIKCTDQEREQMKLLVQNCKISSKETVAQVIIRALSKLKEKGIFRGGGTIDE